MRGKSNQCRYVYTHRCCNSFPLDNNDLCYRCFVCYAALRLSWHLWAVSQSPLPLRFPLGCNHGILAYMPSCIWSLFCLYLRSESNTHCSQSTNTLAVNAHVWMAAGKYVNHGSATVITDTAQVESLSILMGSYKLVLRVWTSILFVLLLGIYISYFIQEVASHILCICMAVLWSSQLLLICFVMLRCNRLNSWSRKNQLLVGATSTLCIAGVVVVLVSSSLVLLHRQNTSPPFGNTSQFGILVSGFALHTRACWSRVDCVMCSIYQGAQRQWRMYTTVITRLCCRERFASQYIVWAKGAGLINLAKEVGSSSFRNRAYDSTSP